MASKEARIRYKLLLLQLTPQEQGEFLQDVLLSDPADILSIILGSSGMFCPSMQQINNWFPKAQAKIRARPKNMKIKIAKQQQQQHQDAFHTLPDQLIQHTASWLDLWDMMCFRHCARRYFIATDQFSNELPRKLVFNFFTLQPFRYPNRLHIIKSCRQIEIQASDYVFLDMREKFNNNNEKFDSLQSLSISNVMPEPLFAPRFLSDPKFQQLQNLRELTMDVIFMSLHLQILLRKCPQLTKLCIAGQIKGMYMYKCVLI